MPALFEKNHQFPDLPAVSPVAGFCNPYQFEQFHSYLQRANFPSPIAQELRMFHAPSHVANSHVYDSLKKSPTKSRPGLARNQHVPILE